ncbi:hypothetical protein HYX19_01410 [Candidatus Woesearchaeota archaeon]|nr:hypothetical protein [Candidatus Woesearchaeota archaeon]
MTKCGPDPDFIGIEMFFFLVIFAILVFIYITIIKRWHIKKVQEKVVFTFIFIVISFLLLMFYLYLVFSITDVCFGFLKQEISTSI